MGESREHLEIKNKIAEKLKSWFGCSITEYPSSGHELDIFAVTNRGTKIYVEIIWSTTQVHFLKDLNSVEHADAQIKIVVVNPEILDKKEYLRLFDKSVAYQRSQGNKIHGELLNGSVILNEKEYLDDSFKHIIDSLLSEIETIDISINHQKFASEEELNNILKEYAKKVVSQYTNYSRSSDKESNVIDPLSKFDFKKYYVKVFVEDLKNGMKTSAENLVYNWLSDPTLNGLFIIGDFGTGKSTLCVNLVYELAFKFLNDVNSRIPIFIQLRNVENISKDSIAQESKKLFNIEWEQLIQLAKSGRAVFILDGFDEIPRKTDWKKTIEEFEAIVKIFCDEKCKVITTCRTHFFKKDSEIWGEDTDLMKSLRASKNFKIVSMVPFSKEKIFEFIKKRTNNPEEIWLKIENTYNLEDLCKRPLLADMILTTLPKLVSIGTEISPNILYDKYTEEWIEREDWRSQLTPSAKEELMEKLAFTLYCQEKYFISYEALLDLIEKEFPVKKESDVSKYYDFDIRNCSFFRRDAEGNYSFMHKSFLEFFVGKKLARSINNGSFLELSKKNLTNEVVFFAKKIINESKKNVLLDAIYSTRSKTVEEYGILGGNAIKLLCKMGSTKFNNIDFSSCTFQNAEISDCVFDNCKLKNVRFKKITFLSSNFWKTDFSEAKLESCSLVETNLAFSDFTNTKFIDGTFDNCRITNNCLLTKTTFDKCSFSRLVFEDIILNEASFENMNPSTRFLSGISFVRSKMKNVQIKNSYMPLSIFREFNIEKTSFIASNFDGTFFNRCEFDDFILKDVSLSFTTFLDIKSKKTSFENTKLYKTFFGERDRTGISFVDLQLESINEPYHKISKGKSVKLHPNLEAFCALNRVIEIFSMNTEFENKVIEKYLALSDMLKPSERISAIAFCLHDLCVETQRPRTLKEVAKAFNVNMREIYRTNKWVCRYDDKKRSYVTCDSWLELFIKELKISEKTANIAKEILTDAKNNRLATGRGNATIAAAILYIACKKNSENITLKSIANLAELTTTAISQASKSIKERLDSSNLSN